jgi:excisionase family DNA binding protein
MKELFTTFEIAKLCKVDITTVINWVNAGKLQAYKTPGGHRRIRKNDFLKFLKQYNLPVPKELGQDKMTLLIVDDEEELRKMMRRVIQRKWPQFEILEAEDGFKAGKLLAEKKPLFVILDIKLPGIDGIEVCKIIREDQRLKDTKILVITGYFSASMKQSAINAGANECISKPFQPGEIVKYIEKMV